MKRTTLQRKLNRAAVLLLIVTVFITLFFTFVNMGVVYAEEQNEFDKTDVLEDLQSADNFNLADYPFSANGNTSVINVVEYCYSADKSMRGNYGLYIYVYNPRGKMFAEFSSSHSVQIAVAFDEKGVATDYAKFPLKVCSYSKGMGKEYLFCKFRAMVDTAFIDSLNADKRVYSISGVEIKEVNSSTATDIAFGFTYEFSGFAKGYGDDTKPLTCHIDPLEVVSIDISDKHSVYRSDMNNEAAVHHNQVNSVYFSIPNSVLEKYGSKDEVKLQRIKLEWYEYRTEPIVVTNEKLLFSKLHSFLGEDIGNYNADIGYSLSVGDRLKSFDWVYNVDNGIDIQRRSTSLNWLFLNDDLQFDSVSRNQLLGHMKTFSENDTSGTVLPIPGRNISAKLFNENVGAGRNAGYNVKDFDAQDDTFSFTKYEPNKTGWQSLLEVFGLKNYATDTLEGRSPIKELVASDFESGSDALLVNNDDIISIASFYRTAIDNDETPFIFYYAVTDYFASKLNVSASPSFPLLETVSDIAYMAEQNVFLDLDIIQFTFKNDQKYYTMPVVSSPIDVVSPVEPPEIPEDVTPDEVIDTAKGIYDEVMNKLKAFFNSLLEKGKGFGKVLMIVLGVVLVVLVLSVLSPILIPLIWLLFKGVIWILSLPIKAVKAMVKKRERKKKDSNG